MIKSNLFIRFAALGIVVSGLFLILSALTTHWMRNLIFNEPFRGDRGPFRTYEIFLDKVPPSERVEALRDGRGNLPPAASLRRRPPPPSFGAPPENSRAMAEGMPPQGDFEREMHPPMPPPPQDGRGGPAFLVEMYLLDSSGRILFPDSVESEKSERVAELFQEIKKSTTPRLLKDDYSILQLSGAPVQYFVRGIQFKPPSPPLATMIYLNLIQLITIILAVLVTLAVVLYSLRSRARQADAVMEELSRGNLKARIDITKMDEIGQTMFSFNKMADEIEHLIEHLRKTENARRDLLRELAHDLRTPVASMKSLIETVSMRSDQLPKEKIRELLDLAMKEAEYFEGLVDDLLFIGRVGEPKYKTSIESVDLTELADLEVDAISARHPNIHVEMNANEELIEYDGDPSLLKRLIRNALENAASFAKNNVRLTLEKHQGAILIRVSDDGPGFDASSLSSFGQRKYSRAMTQSGGSKRISIGLGSVIMKSIVDVHRGDLGASNRVDANGDILGADVIIRLPLA